MWYYFFSEVRSRRVQLLKVTMIHPNLIRLHSLSFFLSDYLFGGRAVAGLSVGALTHVIPMYLAEISSANVRGSLVSLQQLAITVGVSLRIISSHPLGDLSPCFIDPRELYVFQTEARSGGLRL